MSRSKKKHKIRGITTASTEKQDKRHANRRLRRRVRQQIVADDKPLPKLREVSNVWSFSKDGKVYVPSMSEQDLRK